MKQIILRLAEDNTMSFSREVDNQTWLGGYYGNNSRYRLQRLIEKIEVEFGAGDVESIDGAQEFVLKMRKYYGFSNNKIIKQEDTLAALELQFDQQKQIFDFIKHTPH